MEFEKKTAFSEFVGKRCGILSGILLFSSVLFFVAGKTGLTCWSQEKYGFFVLGFSIFYLIMTIIKRRAHENKIVS